MKQQVLSSYSKFRPNLAVFIKNNKLAWYIEKFYAHDHEEVYSNMAVSEIQQFRFSLYFSFFGVGFLKEGV